MEFWVCAVVVLFLDQLSKKLMIELLPLVNDGVISLGAFDLRIVYNKGAAFGMLQGHRELFVAVAVCAVGAAVYYLKKYQPGLQMKIVIGLIIGGALGNLTDRVLLGYVVDFIDFRWWPVFNLADSAIVVGACLLAVTVLRDGSLEDGCDE